MKLTSIKVDCITMLNQLLNNPMKQAKHIPKRIANMFLTIWHTRSMEILQRSVQSNRLI